VIKSCRPRSSVTQREEEKSETLTAPNPRPLLVPAIGNISRYQYDNAHLILVHNHPSGDPTASHADIEMTKAIVETPSRSASLCTTTSSSARTGTRA
jgi:hypothetical protein